MSQNEVNIALRKCNRGAKRKPNIENWKDNKRKRLRNSGGCYQSRKGKIINGKTPPGKACGCGCNYTCAKFDEEEIKKRYAEFYKMNYEEQSSHLASLIELKEPKRRRVKEGTSRRNVTVNYFLFNSNRRKERVCRKMICHTLQITQRRVQILVEKLKKGSTISDQRGKHTNRPHKIVDAEKESVIEHIASFPSQESHYSRSSSKHNYLNPNLSVVKMFDLYKLKYPNTLMSYSTYRHIFNTSFKLWFGFPRSDTCKTCDKFFIDMISAINLKDLDAIQKSAEIHHTKAEKLMRNLDRM